MEVSRRAARRLQQTTLKLPGAQVMEADRVSGPWLIGWKEYVGLPDWGIRRLKAKIDTGARTSAVDAASYEIRQTAAGLRAVLRLHLSHRDPAHVRVVEAPVLRMVTVCNTAGLRERRPLIETTLCLGPLRRRVPLTVTSRSGMLFRLILGRTALDGDFIVDVSRKYLCQRMKEEG
jgi:hypothetical protein